MTDGTEHHGREIEDLRSEIAGIRGGIRRFIEHASEQHIDTILGGLRREYAEVFAREHLTDADQSLRERVIQECPMRDRCYAAFYEFLKNAAEHIRDGEVSEEVIRSYRDRLGAMRKGGKFDDCSTCFTETNRLFEKQIDLMRSPGIYRSSQQASGSIAGLPGEVLARGLFEPLANRHRFRILQSLSVEKQTFSDLSTLTDLRGGNLLFHLKKLQDAGMILQRHERGDSIITEKGYKTLKGIGTLCTTLRL
ncbi:ArsR family transcriptional regulator [Methanoculleus sp. FWC-SCC1]|uniref:ArsR family transcriptional regulator n=1 Tax=Methanoculleus frigidifontis TaxID=2584085 RepID=A0ABT8MAM8_9EURY|nr:winged helix-turn-helix domain-containing protein [Methanoculleus sp. FWC-SCC1]MDN7024994.1 ArsR family transcriptional regulator [Methanoculleus sp. FWC-SCC1]